VKTLSRLRYKIGRHVRQNPRRLLAHMVRNGLTIESVIHCGAHLGQERGYYAAIGAQEVLWIEGSPTTFARLETSLEEDRQAGRLSGHHRAVIALLFAESGRELTLHGFSNDGESNSIYHSTQSFSDRWGFIQETGEGERMVSSTLDDINRHLLPNGADLLVLDLQGAELSVLSGGSEALGRAKAVICEVSKLPIYEGGALYPDVVRFMADAGFKDMHRSHTVGDVLFLRQEIVG
jgi:FkbM family methyltransferase